jgi:hypothetical protein
MNKYIVIFDRPYMGTEKITFYLKRIHSYSKNQYQNTIILEEAFKYKLESSALKASLLVGGRIKII